MDSTRAAIEQSVLDSVRQDALARLHRSESGKLFISYTQALSDSGAIPQGLVDGLRTRAAQLTPQLEVVR
jgi:hypothetical protein